MYLVQIGYLQVTVSRVRKQGIEVGVSTNSVGYFSLPYKVSHYLSPEYPFKEMRKLV